MDDAKYLLSKEKIMRMFHVYLKRKKDDRFEKIKQIQRESYLEIIEF